MSVLYIFSEGYLRKMETRRSFNGVYVKIYIILTFSAFVGII
jgi:hypothetical protein